MNELNHWHPVLKSAALRQKPIGIELCGQEIVLFRTQSGKVGALKDRCPHRRMRLSLGWVEAEQLVCPFHGWRYGCDGQGHSPSTPRLKPCAEQFETAERYGWIWLKAAKSETSLPDLDFPDYHLACSLEHRIQAPLELVIDIFAEMEHAPTSHTFFGYGRSQVADVEPRFDFSDPTTIKLLSIVPQRSLPWIFEKMFGIRGGDRFFNHLTMHFSPMYHTYEIYWEQQKTGQLRQERLLSVFFFNPINSDETQCMSLHYLSKPQWGMPVFHLLQKHVLKYVLDHEVKRDKWVLENIADKQVDLQQLCLGRFDRILIEYRKRLQRIYRGQGAVSSATQSEPSKITQALYQLASSSNFPKDRSI
ncbi:Rieske 2Fe-2S domain-containing protein [Leptothoe spongobia]|uniref:Rieske 2Fe-2S domain-containing protein n=1 Tax=Leptothoe spongobia TAU-MAC 1115 TaxID=1967444 RepID=A0A947DEU1_9CYAN|nr:Rieske 2Fe-2S domain-containing protein [Leptothoe spongobia]MBT9315802.1 Rieske 2Fe-2S domain-containing protein [Leptothoe spongobia TAU-MAC 1115]